MVAVVESHETDADLPAQLAATVAWLTDIPLGGLSPSECLAVMETMEAAKGVAAAVQARATEAFITARDATTDDRVAAGSCSAREASRARGAARAEVALARRCSPSQADRHVGLAAALTRELPHTMAALSVGEISEWRATIVARETATLAPPDRREADRRLAPSLATLGERSLAGAARRACIDLDAEAVVRRRERAVASRAVSVRPAPDGMAYLSILGTMVDVVGAHASLIAAEKSRYVATGDSDVDATRAADERGRGAWMSDTALERLSGRAPGAAQPIEVALVMEESAFFPAEAGWTAESRAGLPESGAEPPETGAELPGWGAVPASSARAHLLRLLDEDATADSPEPGIWLRRLWTRPDGRDLVAMDSRRRFFGGALRRLVELRDPVCRVPWCDAPAVQIDHVVPAACGGGTSPDNAAGQCQRHNLVKEEPGWTSTVVHSGLDPGGGPHEYSLTTPAGRTRSCVAAPLLGHGSRPRQRTRASVEVPVAVWESLAERAATGASPRASTAEAHFERLLAAA